MRFDGLPLHPLVVHFPVALLSVSVGWDALALWLGVSFWWRMSFWTLAVGLLASLPAILTGLTEYATLSADAPAEDTATWHLMLTGGAVTFFLVSLLVRGGPEPVNGGRLVGALACSLVGLTLLAPGGHLGARLVYQFGVGHEPRSPS